MTAATTAEAGSFRWRIVPAAFSAAWGGVCLLGCLSAVALFIYRMPDPATDRPGLVEFFWLTVGYMLVSMAVSAILSTLSAMWWMQRKWRRAVLGNLLSWLLLAAIQLVETLAKELYLK